MKNPVWIILFLVLFSAPAFAGTLADADYTTPQTWQQHITPNGFVKSQGMDLGGGTFNLALTSRYKLNFNDYASDQSFYQYLKAGYKDLPLGNGTFSANLYMRVAKDIDGNNGRQWGDKYYYFYDDILDAESRNNDWAPRFYQGNITFNNVVEGTKLTIGRQYVDHLYRLQLDGGNLDVSLLDGKLGLFAYGGLPVSYFSDTKKSWLAGGGIEVKPVDFLKFRAEYIRSDILTSTSNVVKVRGDYTHKYGFVYAQYGNNNGKNFYELGTMFRFNPSKTSVSLVFEQLLDTIGSSENYYTDPLAYVLSPYGKFVRGKLMVQQGLNDYLVFGVGGEVKKVQGDENYDNRNYNRIFANFDIVKFPFSGTYLSLNADYWDITANGISGDNNQITFGAQLTHVINEAADIWIGTNFDRFRYDIETGKYADWIRTYYAGAQWRINRYAAVTADFTYEDSQILRSVSSELIHDFTVQVWLNISL